MRELSVRRGTTRRFRIEVWQPRVNPTDPRIPYALAGSELVFVAKDEPGDAAPLITKTIGAGIEVPGEPVNTAFLAFGPADTEALDAPLVLDWDLTLVTPSGERYPVDTGRLYVPDAP